MDRSNTMKERLLDQTSKSDIPTITYVTPRAIAFYVAGVAAVIAMFGNWFAMDLNLGFMQFDDILGTLNPFTIVSTLGEIKNSVGMFSVFLPSELMSGLNFLQFLSIIVMIMSIAAIPLYVYAAYLRIKENDMTAKYARMASVCALASSVVFVIMVVWLLAALDVPEYIGDAIGRIATGPCMITVIASIVTALCSPMDMGFKEDVVIFHDGVIKIDKGPKWRCKCCARNNLSLLEKCYYCGKEK